MGFASCSSFLLFFLFLLTAGNSAGIHRHLLHHPFFPVSTAVPPINPPSIAPAAQPPPQTQPKYPFTAGPFPPEKPFFPTLTSPPPPSVSALATFPANVSDLLFPHPPSAAVSHRHLIITIVVSVSLLIAAVVAAVSAFLLYSRCRKTSRSGDPRLFPPDSVPSDGSPKPPKLPHRPGVPNRSSEFLYLGILPNSKSGVDHPPSVAKASNAGVKIGASSSPYRKLGSPELKPLPPLPKHNYTPTYRSGEVLVRPCKEDEGTEEGDYFSPSPERKESLARVESSSRRDFAGIQGQDFGSYSCSSSPGSNSSPRSTKSKSSDTKISIPPPVKRSPLSISLSSSPSLSENSDYSPNLNSVQRNQPPATRLPQPPPPLRRSWEFPVVENAGDLRSSGPPVLVAPSMPILVPSAMPGQSQSNANVERNNGRRRSLTSHNQENYAIDPRKSQSIAILLRSLNVTVDEVFEALVEGNLDTLGTELLDSLLKMAPTKEEECELKEFSDESLYKLGPAEKFLKALLDIPFAFKRVDALLYIANFDSEIDYLSKSFQTLEAACQELKKSRMFLKLLEAVLKAGNHLNADTNHAFKLDTLLKLVDVKGTDGKTTLLHFVVQEIIRSEGSRLSCANHNKTASTFQDDVEFQKLGLQVVSGLSGELSNVKRAAAMDPNALSNEVRKLTAGISKVRDLLKSTKEISLKLSSRRFSESMEGFLKKADKEIVRIQSEERLVFTLVKEITEYFHGSSDKEEAHPFRIFHIVRDFIAILDQVCKEVGKINERIIYTSGRPLPENSNYPVFNGRQHLSSSNNQS